MAACSVRPMLADKQHKLLVTFQQAQLGAVWKHHCKADLCMRILQTPETCKNNACGAACTPLELSDAPGR